MGLDLDLLRTFLAIYERQSLTRASVALNVTQPSVSYALARLRTQLSDPLFVRTGRGMQPTPRAHEIYEVARAAVDRIDAITSGSDFDPASATARFRVAMTDMGEYAYLPGLMERLAREAPHVGVDVIPLDAGAIDRWIARGEIDAAISSSAPTGHTPFVSLFEEEYACVAAWPEDGGMRGPVTAHELADLRCAVLDSSTGHDFGLTEASEWAPRIVLRVHHVSTLPDTLVRSGLAAIVPSRVAGLFTERWPLSVRPLDGFVPSSTVRLFSSNEAFPSAGKEWFIDVLTQSVKDFAEGHPRIPS